MFSLKIFNMSIEIKNYIEIIYHGTYTDDIGQSFEFKVIIDEVDEVQQWIEVEWVDGKKPEDLEEVEQLIADKF